MPNVQWWHAAACAGLPVGWFFPAAPPAKHVAQRRKLRPRAGADPYAQGKAVCVTCPVRTACLEDALVGGEDEGCWGGLDPLERRDLQHERTAQGQPSPRRRRLASVPRDLPTDAEGRRVCEDCGVPYPKRSGPGRYPLRCRDCADAGAETRAEA